MKLYDILKEELDLVEYDESQYPLNDYFEENYEVENEKLFVDLAEKQKSLNPGFDYELITFSSGKKLFVTEITNKPHTKMVYLVNDDGTVDSGKETSEFLSDLSMDSSYTNFFDEDFEQKYNDEFWSGPSILYHGTNDIDSVLENGLEARDETRGINNKHVGSAVFTTTEVEKAETYGDVVKIDTGLMRRDGFKPFAMEEPELLEGELLGAIAHKIGDQEWFHETGDSGIDHDTVILMNNIPAKYISEV